MKAKENALFIYSMNELKYRFNDRHPFNQKRINLTVDLLGRLGSLPEELICSPLSATVHQLSQAHALSYIEAVRALSESAPSTEWQVKAESFGLGIHGDTPFFKGMHDASSHIVGGTIIAAEAVMSGRIKHALHLGGGLHHAMQGKGSGFCVYNDAAAAIHAIRQKYGARVLYIDTDVHHGDGVQWAFYSDPEVFTLSIHETGKYLFPGTGGVQERGEGNGFGYCLNLPMEPYTEDESWLECFEAIIRRTAASFKPDIIISQHGCDAHAFDPLAHIQCSMTSFLRMPMLIHELAHTWCEGRWTALGGGGYDVWRVVPRAWSLLWLVMTDHPLIAELAKDTPLKVPSDWVSNWQPESPSPLPLKWLDPVHQWEIIPRKEEITKKNRKNKELSLMYLH